MNVYKIKVTYTKEYEQSYFIENGVHASKCVLDISAEAISPAQRNDFITLGFLACTLDGRFSRSNDLRHYELGQKFSTHQPQVDNGAVLEFDYQPTEKEILELAATLATEKRAIAKAVDSALPAWRIEREEKKQQEKTDQVRKAAAREESMEAARLERIERLMIKWNDDTAIHEMYETIVEASGVEQDTRFGSNWVKEITGVDKSKTNGYCFDGEFEVE